MIFLRGAHPTGRRAYAAPITDHRRGPAHCVLPGLKMRVRTPVADSSGLSVGKHEGNIYRSAGLVIVPIPSHQPARSAAGLPIDCPTAPYKLVDASPLPFHPSSASHCKRNCIQSFSITSFADSKAQPQVSSHSLLASFPCSLIVAQHRSHPHPALYTHRSHQARP